MKHLFLDKNDTISSHVKIYLHTWRYRWFHWYQVCLVGVSSKHLRVFLESLRQSSAIFRHLRKFSEILGKCSVFHRNIFGSSLKVSGNLRKSSDIFGNFRKFSENVWKRSSGLWNHFGKFFKNLRKVVGNLQKTIKNVFLTMFIWSKEHYMLARRHELKLHKLLRWVQFQLFEKLTSAN